MSRILFFGVFILILVIVEVYVFTGLKSTFRPGWAQNTARIVYFVSLGISIAGLVSVFYALRNGIIQPGLLINILRGLTVTFFVTKLAFVFFLIGEDVYRVGRYSIEHIAAWFKSDSPPVNFESRRKFIGQLGLVVASIPFGAFLYGITKGKYDYQLHTVKLSFPDLPEAFDGLKIVQVSDIHAGSFDSMAGVKRGVKMIQAQNADLILFTGDLVNNQAIEIEPYKEIFGALQAEMGKFAILGNHDYGDYQSWPSPEAKAENLQDLKNHNEDMGFRMLNNDSLKIEKNGQTIRLAGVENWGHPPFPQYGNLNDALQDIDPDEFTILMSHDPTHWDGEIRKHDKKIQLTLSGHTHGFQMGIELPGLRFSPVQLRYKQWAGHYEEGDGQHLYVNRGFGFIGFPGRVGIWPEVTLIELRRG